MKNNCIYILLCCILILIVCCKCELVGDYDNSITVVNESSHDIDCYFATGEMNKTAYPDTLPPKDSTLITRELKYKERASIGGSLSYKRLFKLFPHDTLSVFIFHTDTVSKYKWERIRSENMILKRYDLSYKDLELMNWYIVYK